MYTYFHTSTTCIINLVYMWLVCINNITNMQPGMDKASEGMQAAACSIPHM